MLSPQVTLLQLNSSSFPVTAGMERYLTLHNLLVAPSLPFQPLLLVVVESRSSRGWDGQRKMRAGMAVGSMYTASGYYGMRSAIHATSPVMILPYSVSPPQHELRGRHISLATQYMIDETFPIPRNRQIYHAS